MGAAFLTSLSLAVMSLSVFGTGQKGTLVGLLLTARCSFAFFVLAYAGGPLATIFGKTFGPIARRGRDLGLAFASAHLVHAGLVAWLYYISPKPPVSASVATFFGVALFFTYTLALFSIPALTARLPAPVWWPLRNFGMDFIALAFLRDFLRVNPFGGSYEHIAGYLPFVALGLTAAAIRVIAYLKRLWRRWLTPQPAG